MALPFDVQLITFCLDYFFIPEFFLTGLLQLFFIKCSNNLFINEIADNVYPWYSILYFRDHKYFFRPIWSVSFCKNIFVF